MLAIRRIRHLRLNRAIRIIRDIQTVRAARAIQANVGVWAIWALRNSRVSSARQGGPERRRTPRGPSGCQFVGKPAEVEGEDHKKP